MIMICYDRCHCTSPIDHFYRIVSLFHILTPSSHSVSFSPPSTLSSSLPFIFRHPLYLLLLLTSLQQLQLSHVATPVALSMAAPQVMASTTMTLCAFPATKATPWRDPPQLSARPAASGASSHRHAEVRSTSYRAPVEWINDWQLD